MIIISNQWFWLVFDLAVQADATIEIPLCTNNCVSLVSALHAYLIIRTQLIFLCNKMERLRADRKANLKKFGPTAKSTWKKHKEEEW